MDDGSHVGNKVGAGVESSLKGLEAELKTDSHMHLSGASFHGGAQEATPSFLCTICTDTTIYAGCMNN